MPYSHELAPMVIQVMVFVLQDNAPAAVRTVWLIVVLDNISTVELA